MSDAIARERPARWPWVVFGGFIVCAGVGTVLVADLEGSVAEEVPFIIAFAMFGIVGALIVSREPGNRVRSLLLYGSGATAASFIGGELTAYLVREGITSGPLVAIAALVSNPGWVIGIMTPRPTGYGTGLQGIADRLGALRGRLEVASRPGSGTRVMGTVEVVA